jgi:hypothetical protein
MKHVLLLIAIAACSGDDPPSAPDRATVEAMRSFCKLADTPFEHRGLAMAHWVERSAKSSTFAATWSAMIRGDKPARKKIQAAADTAVGKGKCDILESFGKP